MPKPNDHKKLAIEHIQRHQARTRRKETIKDMIADINIFLCGDINHPAKLTITLHAILDLYHNNQQLEQRINALENQV